MKLNDVKHNHSLTDLLKILIFSILMMIPFIDVGIRCAYVICNKNAYQSYYGETINEEQKTFYNVSQLETNNNYYQQTPLITTLNTEVSESYMSVANLVINGTSIPEANRLRLYYTQSYATLFAYNTYTQIGSGYNLTNNTNNLSFTFEGILSGNNYWSTLFDGSYYTIEYNSYSYLDNVFDYSVNKLTTSELYTWTQQTAIYTGVHTMCTQLGINNAVIPILLVYWFILTVIYIIIDIVLKLFTMLTHAIGSKTA